MKYVFLKDKNNYIKVDNKFNIISTYKSKDIDINLMNFIKGTILIGNNLNTLLLNILEKMYEEKFYDCSFRYLDIDNDEDIIMYMKKYSVDDLDNIKYKNIIKIFRGLNYNLYLLDNGYYGYDTSDDKLGSFYMMKKEIISEKYSVDEYLYLRSVGVNLVINIFKISEDTIKYTNEYTIYSSHNLEKYPYMIKYMEDALRFIENNNIRLVCIGNILELKENYKILGKEKLDRIISLITREKELWSEW